MPVGPGWPRQTNSTEQRDYLVTMAKIIFLNSRKAFDGANLWSGPLGGVESGMVQLAEALAARGHDLTCMTAIDRPADINGVAWRPTDSGSPVQADLAVANNTASDFRYVRANRHVIWFRNRRLLDSYLRKGAIFRTLWLRPAAVLLGAYHDTQVSRFIPLSRRVTIPHATGEPFTTADPGDPSPRPPRAIHFSQPYRDAQNLVRIWVAHVRPAVPDAEFHIFGGDWRPEGYSDEALAESGIVLRERISKDGLVEEIRQARVMLYRGYKDETYCQAAAESMVMGLPVVTAGIGSLKERVRHGETGLIGESDEAFAEAAIRVLADEGLWSRLHEGALATRGEYTWDKAAARWEEAFL